jgi:hypothetical protein
VEAVAAVGILAAEAGLGARAVFGAEATGRALRVVFALEAGTTGNAASRAPTASTGDASGGRVVVLVPEVEVTAGEQGSRRETDREADRSLFMGGRSFGVR